VQNALKGAPCPDLKGSNLMPIRVYLKDRDEAVDMLSGQEPEWISSGPALVGGPTSVLRVKDSQGKLVAEFPASEVQGWSLIEGSSLSMLDDSTPSPL
jgi:hypothetical protein